MITLTKPVFPTSPSQKGEKARIKGEQEANRKKFIKSNRGYSNNPDR